MHLTFGLLGIAVLVTGCIFIEDYFGISVAIWLGGGIILSFLQTICKVVISFFADVKIIRQHVSRNQPNNTPCQKSLPQTDKAEVERLYKEGVITETEYKFLTKENAPTKEEEK
jgi:hypothetical protein